MLMAEMASFTASRKAKRVAVKTREKYCSLRGGVWVRGGRVKRKGSEHAAEASQPANRYWKEAQSLRSMEEA